MPSVTHARLQHDVTVHTLQGGRTQQLHDALMGRTLDLSPPAAAVVHALDGTHPLNRVPAVAAEAHAQPEDMCVRALRTLVRLTVVKGSGDAIRTQVAEAQRLGGAAPVVSVPGARFACQGSGVCCQTQRLGPLSNDDVSLLDSLSVRAGYPGGPAWEERPGADGRPARYLRSVQSRCVFLDGAARCRLHAAFGPEGKPGFCRTFPLELLRTVDGVRVLDRGLCASLETSGGAGSTLLSQAPTLLAARAESVEPLYHPMLFLHDAPLDFGHLRRFCDALLNHLHTLTQLGPLARVAWVARALARWENALLTFVPGVDAVEPLTDAALQDDIDVTDADAGAWDALLADLEAHIGILAADGFEFHTLARELLLTLSSLRDQEPFPVVAPAQNAALMRTLQSHLFGRDVLLLDRPWPALLRLAAVHAAALHHARLNGTEAFGRGHMLASRLFSILDELFLRHEDRAPAALAALR